MSRLLAALLTITTLTATAAAQFDNPDPHAHPTLLSQTDGLEPGTTSHLALHFTIDPKWHIYWRGQNDSGGPVEVELTLPDGITADPIRWPTPKRYTTQFSEDFKLVDYTYEREVYLVIPISVSADYAADTATITADLQWIECADFCVFQDTSKTITLPVGEGRNTASRHAQAINETLRSIPEPLPRPTADGTQLVRVKRADDAFTLTAPDATAIAFFPDQDGCSLKDVATHGAAKGTTLTLPIQTDGERPDAPLIGLVQITYPDQRDPVTYSLRHPPEAPASTTDSR